MSLKIINIKNPKTMKKHENQNLPFQEKIVFCVAPEEEKDMNKLVELVATAFKAIYGIVILLFGKEKVAVLTSPIVSKKTVNIAKQIIAQDNPQDYLEIVPFPKGLENQLLNNDENNK